MRCLLCALLLLASFCGFAKQLSFEKIQLDEQMQFAYRWLDASSTEQSLTFALPMESLRIHQRKQLNYRPSIAQRYVLVAMYKQAQQVDPREARIQLQQVGDEIQVSVRSHSPQFIEKYQTAMSALQQRAFDDYLQQHYYTRFTSYLGQEGIKPDHIRYASETTMALLPVAQAIYEKLPENSDTREYINLLLSWIQSIPYSTLEDRISSNGAGFSPPVDLLVNNLGDCDSKSTLTAALIRALAPQIPLAMIYLPEHALLGASLPHRANEPVTKINGLDYMLMEPTGPAMFALGEIADSSAADINGNRFDFEIVP